MDTKALRQKILDLAIRGKLVPQDPTDEPASVLLERIRAEKQQMVKEGKLKPKDIKNDTVIFKADDNLHYEKFADGSVKCIEDEIPFELPEGWCWTRLPVITTAIFAGGDKPDIYENNSTKECNIPIYSNGIENDGLYGYTNKPRVTEPSITISARGTIGFCCVRKTPFVPIVRLITITPSKKINLYYLKTVFEALIEAGEGSSIPQLTVPGIKPKLIPIPPINEQDRLQNKLNKVNNYIMGISSEQDDLSELVQTTKSKILDLAIHGKLVPQDPNDEPASVLLERIRTEKDELIKQGKIKRDKKESVIFKGDDNSYYRKKGTHLICIDNELPYNLPDGWIWAMLPEVVFFQEGPGILKKDFRDKGVPLIRISGLKSDRVLLDGCNYLDQIMVENKWKHFKLEFGDVILCTSASIGKASIVGTEAVGAIPYTGQIRFKMTNALLREYFLYFANSDSYLSQINRMKTGNCIQHYGPTHLKEVYIPIPPIKEQKRMVVTIEHYFSQLNKISEVLA